MHDRATLAEAFILHARKYRDTSIIAELLTREQGRVPAVIRGVRGKKSRIAGHVQPFARLLVSWFGRGELKTVRAMDFPFVTPSLSGNALMTGLYVNELLVKSTGKYEPLPGVFDAYGPLIARLEKNTDMPHALRRFELLLLAELGYAVTFDAEAGTGEPVHAGACYRYVPDEGFHRVRDGAAEAFAGEQLLAIDMEDFGAPGADTAAKRIVRSAFSVLLGGKSLRSRELFRKAGTPP